MPKRRLNLFRLPNSKVANELRAATPRVDESEDRRRNRVARARARSVRIDAPLQQGKTRVTLSTGQTAYRDEHGTWTVRRSEKRDLGYDPLGKRWLGLCEAAYQAAVAEGRVPASHGCGGDGQKRATELPPLAEHLR